MKQVIFVDPGHNRMMEAFKEAPVEKQRFLVYSEKAHAFNQIVKYETDEKLCYFLEEMRPRMGTKGFIQRKAKEGFSLDKKKKKVSIWYGKKIGSMIGHLIQEAMTDMKKEWFTAMPENLKHICTRMLLEKIVLGKITNPRDYVKFYLKSVLRVPGISTESYYQLFTAKSPSGGVVMHGGRESNCGFVAEVLRHSKNPEWVVQNFAKLLPIFEHNEVGKDIIKECKILNRKFDWSWSKNRRDEEHKLMSREIRGLELEYIADNTVSYKNMPELPHGWEIINNQKRLFVEGSEQDHCVYNYWSNVERLNYFVLSVKDGANRITASIEKRHNPWRSQPVDGIVEQPKWEIGQIFSKRNQPCPAHLKSEVESWLLKPEIQRFFESQQKEPMSNIYTAEDQMIMVNAVEAGF